MNAVVRDAIATSIAGLSREVATPVAPFGYGTDISCARDLEESMPEVSGDIGLAQAIARRLDCPRGGVPDDGDYGVDLRSYLNRGITVTEQRSIAGAVQSEITKDDRLESARVTVTPSATGDSMRIAVQVVPRDSLLGGPFSLTVAVTDGGALLEEISR